MSSSASAADAADDRPPIASVVPLVPAWRVERDFDYLVPDGLDVRPGSLVRVPFGNRRVRAIVRTVARRRPDRELASVHSLVVPEPLLVPPQEQVYDLLAERYLVPRGRAFDRAQPARIRVRVEDPVPSTVAAVKGGAVGSLDGGNELLAALRSGAPGTWCLQAPPGADRAGLIGELVGAARGQSLVAVPEVALGSRVVEGLAERWPDVARVDVTRPEPERARSWLRLARGHGLGAGGRSVVLAPAPSLSLLVLDDEHHPSYKEDRSPRYDARVLAERRAAIQGAACVFVSTTPSVELAGRAKRGDLGWVGPSRAVERDRRPPVELVETDPDRQLGGVLHGRIRDTLRAGGRVGLLVPRSGFARAVWCAECRRSLRCPVCEAGLVYAREDGVVRCPRCSFRAAPPDVCPTCGGVDFRFLGAGSERLAEQIGAAFPRARVVRMDPAVLETHGSAGVADAQIYVTTWIGVKETLRPEVELVGVLAVDHLVRRPEWRAGERAYQALAEMAEWAGPTGRLLVQTDEPRHHAIQAVVRGSYRFFAERELEQRRELGYPPFSELVKVRASGDRAQEGIAAAAEACRAAGARVLGPIAVTASDGGRALEILAKASSGQEVARSLRSLAADPPDGARMQFDVDPR